MRDWLGRAGMLRRNHAATVAEMRELLPVAAAGLICPECGVYGLSVRQEIAEDEPGWPSARRCQSCGQLIPAERVEVFPNAELCVECQGRADNRLPQKTDEFCERCGSPMVVRTSRGVGVVRQVLACSNPRCRGVKSAAQ
jgi:hypothetical protein